MRFIPVGAFTAFCIKALIISPSQFEVCVIAATAALAGYFYFIDESKRLNKHVEAQNIKIKALEERVEVIRVESENVKSGINQVKTALNFRKP